MKEQGWFSSPRPQAKQTPSISIAKIETPPAQEAGRVVRIAADARGHYASDFSINGRKVAAMIDTGASVVAINRSTARRLGVSVSASDFTHEVNTANGTIKAAPIILSKVEIGRIQVRDVTAVVLEDGALSGALIGMSFLKPLSFTVEDGTFVLKQ
jgi:aspartyl protease family protein